MATLTGANQIGAAGLQGAFWWTRPVEFLHGAERWFIIADTSVLHQIRLRAFMRPGASGDPVEFNAGGGPLCSTATAPAGLAGPEACPTYILFPGDATKILCAYPRAADATLAFVVFDMVARTFGAIVAGGPQVWGTDFAGVVGDRASNDDTGAKTAVAYRAADNKLVFNYQGPPEFVVRDHARPWFVTYDLTAAAWGVAVQLAGAGEQLHYLAHGVVVDATGRTHAIVIKPTDGTGATPTAYEIWHVAIESTNVINAKGLMANDVWRIKEPMVSYPLLRPSAATQELILSYVDNQTAGPGFFKARVARGLVAITPAWTLESVSTTTSNRPGVDAFGNTGVGIADDGTPWVFWATVGVDNTYRILFSQGGEAGAGWTVPAQLFVVVDPLNDSISAISVVTLAGIGFGLAFFFGLLTAGGSSGAVDGVAYFEVLTAPAPPPAASSPAGTTGHWFADLESIWPLDEFGFGSPGSESIC